MTTSVKIGVIKIKINFKSELKYAQNILFINLDNGNRKHLVRPLRSEDTKYVYVQASEKCCWC